MARRHPVITLVLVVVVLLGIVSFARNFEASETLARIERVAAKEEPFDFAESRNAKEAAKQLLNTENEYERSTVDHFHGDYVDSYALPPQDRDIGQNDLTEGDRKSRENTFGGLPIMAKMPNQTTRAAVGNAGWKLIHTILAQFPEEPTENDKETLRSFFGYLSRVYPCQECAYHFQDLLRQFPPQLSSRKAAVLWGCDAHNKVNKRLGKEIFDCAYIFDKYDCGCGDSPE